MLTQPVLIQNETVKEVVTIVRKNRPKEHRDAAIDSFENETAILSALQVLLNLSTIESGQKAIARACLRMLIDMSKAHSNDLIPRLSDRDPYFSASLNELFKGAILCRRCVSILHNVSRCGGNRTLLYREELKEKSSMFDEVRVV